MSRTSRTSRSTDVLACAAVLGLTVAAAGQRRQQAFGGPAVGDGLPAVTGFDADGSRFDLTRLKGKPAVIVFGCLT